MGFTEGYYREMEETTECVCSFWWLLCLLEEFDSIIEQYGFPIQEQTLHNYIIQQPHPFLSALGLCALFRRATLIARSNTSFSPFWVFALHSIYESAWMRWAIFSPYRLDSLFISTSSGLTGSQFFLVRSFIASASLRTSAFRPTKIQGTGTFVFCQWWLISGCHFFSIFSKETRLQDQQQNKFKLINGKTEKEDICSRITQGTQTIVIFLSFPMTTNRKKSLPYPTIPD